MDDLVSGKKGRFDLKTRGHLEWRVFRSWGSESVLVGCPLLPQKLALHVSTLSQVVNRSVELFALIAEVSVSLMLVTIIGEGDFRLVVFLGAKNFAKEVVVARSS